MKLDRQKIETALHRYGLSTRRCKELADYLHTQDLAEVEQLATGPRPVTMRRRAEVVTDKVTEEDE